MTLAALLVWTLVASARGAAPVLDHLFPAAVRPGTTNTLTAIGKFDPWPPAIWSETAGLTFRPTTNSGVFQVEVAPDTPAGAFFVRAHNPEGTSAPRFLVVHDQPQTAEAEPNDAFAKAPPVTALPAHLNGRLEKTGDVDGYAVTLAAGQTLVARLESYVLMSPLDAALRVVDARGIQRAFNHDDGRTLDPRLVWTAPDAGTYVVQVFGFDYPAGSEVRFAGNARGVYRLHLATGPVVRHTLPLGVRRGEKTRLQCPAWNTNAAEGLAFTFDGTALPAAQTEAWIQPPGFEDGFTVRVGDGPEGMEQEPNARTNEVQWLAIPGAITGCLDPVGDVDRHGFNARKGEVIIAELRSAWFGFPLDAWLRIEDGAGKELARNDDAASADPRLEWTAPADGPYFAVVGNLLQRGGPGYLYRLSLARAQPALKVATADSAITLTPGKTHELKLTVTRSHGFAAKLVVEAKSLPPGVRGLPLDVPEKGGEVTFQLATETNAPAFSGPFQVVLREPDSGREHPVVQELVSRGENNGVPQGYQRLVRETLDRFWLTVLSPPPAKPDPQPAAAGK